MPKVTAQKITDIRSSDQLIRYATAAQLAKLGISRTKVGEASTLKDYTLARALGDSGKAELTNDRLRMLDEAIVALNPAMESAGGLASLGIRLRGLTSRGSLVVHVPASWVWEMLQQKAETEFDWLVHASALLSLLMPVERTPRMSLEANLERYQDQISPIAKRLALIGLEPPTPRNIDALILLGSLAKYAFDDVEVIIRNYLEKNPLGFRLWRAVTKLVQLSQEPGCSTPPGLRRWVRHLLMDAERLREKSLYPARSLDLELALAIPANWSQPGGDDWVHRALITRARNESATVRERGTAAMGLWQRALGKSAPRTAREETKQELQSLISEFQSSKAVGLHWVAETLEIVLDGKGEPICNEWPPLQEPWLERVHHAANRLDEENIPADIREATKTLFRHMLLQNAGVERRHAIDTLVAGGWTGPVAKALGQFLEEETESWLRVRALFALGFLQRRDGAVARTLVDACSTAYEHLRGPEEPTSGQIAELHASLFAIGDCFGAGFGARPSKEAATTVQGETKEILESLVDNNLTKGRERYPLARALAYLLTFMTHDQKSADLSKSLLTRLMDHPDPTTQSFARWSLGWRFDQEGKVQPLLLAAIGQ